VSPTNALKAAALANLTPRQLEAVSLLVEGLSNREIAQAMGVSPRTAEHHLDAARDALGVQTRTALVVTLLRHTNALEALGEINKDR
jgi:DNA-binding NarL/FixJ family response regulator